MSDKKKAAVYVTDEEHRNLKAKLAKEGMSISQWLRSLIQAFLGRKDEP